MPRKASFNTKGNISVPNVAPQSQGVHVYLFSTNEGERYLSHTSGNVTAEELCISAAKVVGITPLCHVLFALYNPKTNCWYNPNHVFSPEENSSEVVHYRMRFYFRNWHGLSEKDPTVSRYSFKSGTDQKGSPLLDGTSLEYLFAQAKYEFVNNVEEPASDVENSSFKNESLGMAVLHLSHIAIQKKSNLKAVASKIGFLNCIPRRFAENISNDNFLTKIRIRRVFAKFLQTFQQQTVSTGQLGEHEIMYKYISTLEKLVPSFGTETFSVTSLQLREDGDESISYSAKESNGVSKKGSCGPLTHEIMVSGIKGIQWRTLKTQKPNNSYVNTEKSNQSTSNPPDKWTTFCDFREITHIAITEANVCISTQSSRCMEVQMNSSQEARSFISLIDGYYRLTADAHHYLCHEVAPPRVVLSEANLLHGPMHEDFVLHKLKREPGKDGAFHVRWSALDYHRIILAVLSRTENGSKTSHKQFRIQQKGAVFIMEGWNKEFSSVKELAEGLKSLVLTSGSEEYFVKKCCLPRQGEISNLLVKRQGIDQSPKSDSMPLNMLELRFHQIKDRDLKREQHLGRGTRTNIYSGRLMLREGENGFDRSIESKGIKVVLKILEESHKDVALAFFETASLMSQVSHSHLVFVHGVSVKGSENILVEEFVECGPLDLFLRKEACSITAQWKFIVAQQLAMALSYLETKRLVHGNVCAKNVLVVRAGLEPGSSPFIKLSDPGIGLSVLSRQERLERIPWIAPECIDRGVLIDSAADQWSFGATLLEICNNGVVPVSNCMCSEKENFYRKKSRLANPSSEELASFIDMCLTYEPNERPSFRAILRELTDLIKKNPDICPENALPPSDPSVFQKRYLKKMRDLGEGHFGKVTLYQYDPSNDGTGEFVAVKSLKQESGDADHGWMKEIEILRSLYHANIVKYKGLCTDAGRQEVQLIMEYVPQGSLRDYLIKKKISVGQSIMFAQQICQGMDYLHSKRYVHRDLAARNVLVENSSLVKIGDFGLTKYIPEGEIYYRVREDGDSPVYWYAIECLKELKFSFASDVWSFGVTLYEIITRCDPRQSPPNKFIEMTDDREEHMNVVKLIKLLEKNKRLPCPKDCPRELKALMDWCWLANPEDRPSFSQLLESLESARKQLDWTYSPNFSMSQIC